MSKVDPDEVHLDECPFCLDDVYSGDEYLECTTADCGKYCHYGCWKGGLHFTCFACTTKSNKKSKKKSNKKSKKKKDDDDDSYKENENLDNRENENDSDDDYNPTDYEPENRPTSAVSGLSATTTTSNNSLGSTFKRVKAAAKSKLKRPSTAKSDQSPNTGRRGKKATKTLATKIGNEIVAAVEAAKSATHSFSNLLAGKKGPQFYSGNNEVWKKHRKSIIVSDDSLSHEELEKKFKPKQSSQSYMPHPDATDELNQEAEEHWIYQALAGPDSPLSDTGYVKFSSTYYYKGGNRHAEALKIAIVKSKFKVWKSDKKKRESCEQLGISDKDDLLPQNTILIPIVRRLLNSQNLHLKGRRCMTVSIWPWFYTYHDAVAILAKAGYHMEQVGYEHAGLNVISMEEFLKTEAMTGNLFNKTTGDVVFPPDNRTNWDGIDPKPLKEYLRDVTLTPLNWTPGQCLVAFPSDDGPEHFAELDEMMKEVKANFPKVQEFIDKPTPVNASAPERLREAVAGQIRDLCVYDGKMQEAPVLHFMCYHKMRVRFLTHFYAFLFFESWEQDLFTKRFVRDHLRYSDEIQCAAARVVAAIRDRARRRDPTGNPNGEFDSFHIRRGDFQYKATRLEADQIYENSKDELKEKATVFVATDHQEKPFFKPLADHYDLVFLKDFKEELKGVNTNYYGMIDQLVASRGRVFFGCYHSTFSGFIFRVRGYHAQKDKVDGWDQGVLPNSYYYSGKNEKRTYQSYGPLRTPYYSREFPTSWRDIDKGIEELSALGA